MPISSSSFLQAASAISCVSLRKRGQLEAEVKGAPGMEIKALRCLFDVVAAVCLKTLEREALNGFLTSSLYNYVLALKAKEGKHPTMEHFKALRVLGEGGFGQVLEVVKRDCGKHYAMKVMKKNELREVLGSGWQEVVKLERVLHAQAAGRYTITPRYVVATPSVHTVCPTRSCTTRSSSTSRTPSRTRSSSCC